MSFDERKLPRIGDDLMREQLARAKAYTLVLLSTGPGYSATDPAVRQTVWEHGRRNFALREAGLLPIVAPTTDEAELCGIGIFDAPVEGVREIMEGDPGVRAGVFTFELHPIRGFPGSALP